jgi:outer membrane protein
MKTKLLLLLLFVAAATTVTHAQTDSAQTRVWDLKECVEYALKNNLVIKRGESSVRNSEIDLNQSKFSLAPSVNGSVSYGFNWGRTVDPVTYEYTTQELRSMNPSLNSSVILFNGLRNQNSIKQYSRAYYASEQELQKTRNDVMVNITSLYINVIFNKEQLENARLQLASSQAQLDRVRKQVAAGSLAKSEELNLDAQVATNEVNLVQRENFLNLSILQLKQALQIPATEPLDVELIELNVEDLILEQSRDEIYDIARQTMPEIKAAKLRVESSYYAVKAAKGGLYPRLSLFGSVGTNYSSASDRERFIPDGGEPVLTGYQQIGLVEGTNQVVLSPIYQPSGSTETGWGYRDQLNDNLQRSVGISLAIPILNGFQTRSSIQRSIVSRDIATIAAAETDNTLRQNVENSYNDALAASKTYNANLRQVAAREEAFRMMEQRRAAGAANSFEYQISENDLFRAKSDLTRAKYEFIFRKKILDFYQGKPLDY